MTNIELSELIRDKAYAELSDALYETNEVDIADILQTLPPAEAVTVFRLLKKDQAADVFAELDSDVQQNIINSISNAEIEDLVEDLNVDDAVDLVGELPANIVKRVLKNARPDTRTLINRFLNYAPDSAGSIMTAEYLDLKKGLTASQAINRIRTCGADKETVYVCYVTDARRVLEGVVSFRDLLLADGDETIEELMNREVVSVHTDDDREEVAGVISHYGFLAVPVVDAENRLVGIVTVDDTIDVIERETTEDFHKMAAVLPSDEAYLDTPVYALARNRVVWLLVLMVSSTLSGMVLSGFEHALTAVPALVTFVPMLMGTAGNAGTQVSTTIIRSFAVGELTTRDWRAVVKKELAASFLVGATLAAANFLRILIWPGGLMLALSVSLSLFAAVLIAKLCAALLSVGAKAVGIDPAVMAAPLLTTVVDITSLLIYFFVSAALLGL